MKKKIKTGIKKCCNQSPEWEEETTDSSPYLIYNLRCYTCNFSCSGKTKGITIKNWNGNKR
jgi:hypothetical protein